eukprot:Lankesteria_metandrocarpae@DN3695_c0_g1_i2.p1
MLESAYLRYRDKHHIVVHVGEWTTKVGIAAECAPRAVVPSPEMSSYVRTVVGKSPLSVDQWLDSVSDLLVRIFHHYLLTNTKERSVVLVESPLCPQPLREAIHKVLFELFQVPSVIHMCDLVAPLFCVGVDTGLVVDIGHGGCRVLPVCFGVPLSGAFCHSASGGKLVNAKLRELMKRDAAAYCNQIKEGELNTQKFVKANKFDLEYLIKKINALTDNQLETIKLRHCRVRQSSNSTSAAEDRGECFQLVTVGKSTRIPVAKKSWWQACECLVDMDSGKFSVNEEDSAIPTIDRKSVVDCAIEALEMCDLDTRPLVVQNVLVCGGSAEFPGLLLRFGLELRKELRNHDRLSPLEKKVAFGSPLFSPLVRQWVGAAVASAGTVDVLEEYSQEMYLEDEPIPDSFSVSSPSRAYADEKEAE